MDKWIELLKAGVAFIEAVGSFSKAILIIGTLITGSFYLPSLGEENKAIKAPTLAQAKEVTVPQKRSIDKIKEPSQVKLDKRHDGWTYFTGKVNNGIVTFSQDTNLRADYPKFPLYDLGSFLGVVKKDTHCDVLDKRTVGFGKTWLKVICPS